MPELAESSAGAVDLTWPANLSPMEVPDTSVSGELSRFCVSSKGQGIEIH